METSNKKTNPELSKQGALQRLSFLQMVYCSIAWQQKTNQLLVLRLNCVLTNLRVCLTASCGFISFRGPLYHGTAVV